MAEDTLELTLQHLRNEIGSVSITPDGLTVSPPLNQGGTADVRDNLDIVKAYLLERSSILENC